MTDLVVPIGSNQQQVPHLRVRHQMLEQVERRTIQPLQIIKEQRERVLLARKHAKEAPEYHLEAALGLLRRQVWNRWLFAVDELQFRNEVHDELTIHAQRLAEGIAPTAKFHLALTQQRAHQALEGLGQRGVRNIALVLVKFAGRVEPAREN